MCIWEDDEIKEARTEKSDLKCECGRLLREHTTTKDAGVSLVSGLSSPDEVLKTGDILLAFDHTAQATDYARNPFLLHPRNQVAAKVVLASGFVGRSMRDVSGTMNTLVGRLVLMRRLPAPRRSPSKSGKKNVKVGVSRTTPLVWSH